MTPSFVAIALLMAWSAMLFGATAVAASKLALSRRKTREVQGASLPPFALVRPCAGYEPHLERALRSVAQSSGPRPLDLVFAIERESDEAAPIARAVASWLNANGQSARVVMTGARGPNRKSDQLRSAIETCAAEIPVVVVVDSDVDLAGFDFSAFLASFADDRLAAVWAPPIEVETDTLANRASCAVLTSSLHSFGVLAQLDPRGMVGKTMALRRAALEHVGGFGGLTRHLGEDMELAQRFLASGYRLRATTEVAHSLATRRHWDETVERFARWITVIRMQRPRLLASYPLFLAATFPLLVSTLFLTPFAPRAAATLAAFAVVTRFAITLLARNSTGQSLAPSTALRDAILADVVLWHSFLRAMRTKTVRWRRRELHFDRDGLLVARTSQPP